MKTVFTRECVENKLVEGRNIEIVTSVRNIRIKPFRAKPGKETEC